MADTFSVELNDPAAQKTKFITLANKPSFRGCLQIRHALCLNYITVAFTGTLGSSESLPSLANFIVIYSNKKT